jgi:hypothetical protein
MTDAVRHVDDNVVIESPRTRVTGAPLYWPPSASSPGRVVLLITEVLGHLLVQRGLEHRLGQLFEQLVGQSARQLLLLGQAHELGGGALPRSAAGPAAGPPVRSTGPCRLARRSGKPAARRSAGR